MLAEAVIDTTTFGHVISLIAAIGAIVVGVLTVSNRRGIKKVNVAVNNVPEGASTLIETVHGMDVKMNALLSMVSDQGGRITGLELEQSRVNNLLRTKVLP